MNVIDEKLNPSGQVFSVLGHLANNPSELLGSTYKLSDNDFVQTFHKTLFNAISNIAIESNGQLNEITPVAVEQYLKPFPKYYKIWSVSSGAQYLADAKESEKQFIFNHDYEVVKKFSVLRQYYNQGIDIKDWFDYEEQDINIINKMNKKIDSADVSDIVNYFTEKVINLRNDINENNSDIVRFDAKDDIDSLLQRLSEAPVMGHPFIDGYYNTLFRGMQSGRFMLRSSQSGNGKTRSALRDMANISFSERYNIGKGWEETNNATIPTLFISTELNKDELQTILLAYVSGFTTAEIEEGNFTRYQMDRLKHAIEVIKKSQMEFVYIEDFSVTDIQMTIEENVIKHGTKFVVFDYIQNSPKLSRSLQGKYGHNLREDEILIELSRSLKNLSEKYGIFIMSSTQLNGYAEDENIRVSRGARVLRGGSATINKADYGIVMAKTTKADLKKLDALSEDIDNYKQPNFGHFIFKNRSGMSDIIIWTKYNMGNMRETPLFITDYSYNLITDIKPTEVKLGDKDAVVSEVEF